MCLAANQEWPSLWPALTSAGLSPTCWPHDCWKGYSIIALYGRIQMIVAVQYAALQMGLILSNKFEEVY